MRKIWIISVLILFVSACQFFPPVSTKTTEKKESQVFSYDNITFKTESLTQNYLKNKMTKLLTAPVNSQALVKEIYYANYKNRDLLKAICAENTSVFTALDTNVLVIQKKSDPVFLSYLNYINPFTAAPVANAATGIQQAQFTANWNSISNATGYELVVSGGTPIVLGLVTTSTVTGLKAGTAYNYIVRAKYGGSNVSANSNTIELTTLPVVATAATSIANTSFQANWLAVSGATGYELVVSGSGSGTGTFQMLSTDLNKVVTGLTPVTAYSYVVRAKYGGSNVSGNSNTINQATLTATPPVAGAATNITNTSFQANWTAAGGATGYELVVTPGTTYTLGTVTNSVITGLTADTGYSYVVRAIYPGSAVSANSGTINLTTLPDAQAFITAANITDSTQQGAVTTLVTDLKTAGLWTKLKAIYPFVGGVESSHKYNLKDPRDLDAAFRLTFAGGWTHSATGALPDGTTGYANTHLNASSNLTANNAHMSYYSRTDNATTGKNEMGCSNGTVSGSVLGIRSTATTFDARLNTSDATADITYTGNNQAYYIENKTTTTVNVFRNNVLFGSAVPASVAPPNFDMYIGAQNLTGTASGFSSRETAFATIGDGLTDTEAYSLYNAVEKFETTLTRQNPSVVTGNLVINLDAGNPLSYPGTGTTWTNLGTYAHNATLISGVTYNSANSGSLVFDGSNDYGTIQQYNFAMNSITVSAWVNPAIGNSLRVFSAAGQNNSTNGGWWFGPDNRYNSHQNGISLQFHDNSGNFAVYNTTTFQYTTGQWIYMVGVYDRSDNSIKIYANGVLRTSSLASSQGTIGANITPVLPIDIGQYDHSRGLNFFNGKIATTQIYDRALSAAEVSQNFNALRTRYGI